MIDTELLEILVCPKCKQPLDLRDAKAGENAEAWLICKGSSCGLRYPVREGIPIMLIEEAQPAQAGGQ